MTKEEIRARYARIPTDFSQIEMLKNQLIDSGILDVAQINPENAGKAIVFDENGVLTVGEASSVSLDGNSLVIPEQEGPEPVITIDGVAYYHKQEFDLENLIFSPSTRYDVLTGDVIQSGIYPSIGTSTIPMGEIVKSAKFDTAENVRPDTIFDSRGLAVEYVSKAFELVENQSDVVTYGQICLPTCSAYYGFLSEDGKTFISYFNLKSDTAPEYVNSIKQGNAIIQLKDDRLPTAKQADIGKVLKVGSNAEFELGNLEGTSLKSTDEGAGKVLQSDGSGNVLWGTPSSDILNIIFDQADHIPTLQEIIDKIDIGYCNCVPFYLKYSYHGSVRYTGYLSYLEIPSYQGGGTRLEFVFMSTTYRRMLGSVSVTSTSTDFNTTTIYNIVGNSKVVEINESNISDHGEAIFIPYRVNNSNLSLAWYNTTNTEDGEYYLAINKNGTTRQLYLRPAVFIPSLPSDASSKTYVLKAVNGTLTWIEETA